MNVQLPGVWNGLYWGCVQYDKLGDASGVIVMLTWCELDMVGMINLT